jgi:4'-phosphopantetheinyl transferase
VRLAGAAPNGVTLVFRWPDAGVVDVWFLRVSAVTPAVLRSADAVLSREERARAAAFRLERDAARYRAAHLGLRTLLGMYVGLPPEDLPLATEPCRRCGGPHGKPTLALTGCEFSLSRSHDLVAYAFATSPVGIDVEAKGPYAGLTEVLHARELRALQDVPAARAADAVAQCWVRKEAYVKGTGVGLGDTLDVYVGLGREFGDASHESDLDGWTVTDLAAPDGYAAAVATNRPVTVKVRGVPPGLLADLATPVGSQHGGSSR